MGWSRAGKGLLAETGLGGEFRAGRAGRCTACTMGRSRAGLGPADQAGRMGRVLFGAGRVEKRAGAVLCAGPGVVG